VKMSEITVNLPAKESPERHSENRLGILSLGLRKRRHPGTECYNA
jgi:hypothetical protein